jgi:putative lipoprotein
VNQISVLIGVLLILLPTTACTQDTNTTYQEALKREQALAVNNVWHAAKLRGVSFRAIGQEPSWLLEIIEGQEILLVTDYGKSLKAYPYVQPEQNKTLRRSQFQLEGATVELEGKHCVDIMSGEAFETQVSITLGSRVLNGCGRALF